MSLKMTVHAVRRIVDVHDKYWNDSDRRNECYRLGSAYMTRFWQDQDGFDLNNLQVQTSDGYGYIESYVASLFARNPAVVMKSGLRSKGDVDKAQAAANWWLREYARKVAERATRRGLTFPFSSVKLFPVAGEADPYNRIRMRVLMPWETIIDDDADDWTHQRWVGHVYWIPLGDALEKFGTKKFDIAKRVGYFDELSGQEQESPEGDDNLDRQLWGYIRVTELYVGNMRYFWSPQYQNGEKFILAEKNPFDKYNGEPVIPIIPMYYNYDITCPLYGYSSLRRVYDQIREKNVIRTYKARAIRKVARTYLAKKGVLDEEKKAQLVAGYDGLILEIDEDDPQKALVALQHQSIPTEVDTYTSQVQGDLDRGSVMAPFTRGEATKASATEISALEVYSSSEIGRLARERDSFIENLVSAFLPMLALYLKNATEGVDIVNIDGSQVVLRPEDLLGDFSIYAQDSARTPLSDAARKHELLTLLGTLAQLGVKPDVILKELARRFDLPESFVQGQVENQGADSTPAVPTAPRAEDMAGMLKLAPQVVVPGSQQGG